jgi:hypothetical protein
MLPLRLAIITAIAAVCLWGLFSLLDTLGEPGLLRTEKAVVLKGCDTLEPQTLQLCAGLRCQKSLLDQKRVLLRARFDMRATAAGWVGGRALDPRSQAVLGYFACEHRRDGVITAARWLDEQQFETLQERD